MSRRSGALATALRQLAGGAPALARLWIGDSEGHVHVLCDQDPSPKVDVDDAALSLAQTIRSVARLGQRRDALQVTAELDEALLIGVILDEQRVVGFLFDPGTPLGAARWHVERIVPALRELPRDEHDDDAVDDDSGVDAWERAELDEERSFAPTSDDRPPESGDLDDPMADPLVSAMPFVTGDEGPSPFLAESALETSETRDPVVETESGEPPSPPPAPDDSDPFSAAPLSLRELVEAHAGDTHRTLLRVALRTGIPVERLKGDDALDDDERGRAMHAAREILNLNDTSSAPQ